MTEAEMVRVLALFDDCDCHNSLYWHVKNGEVSFSAVCSDLFFWATADVEGITGDDLPVLEECAADLKVIGDDYSEIYLPELYASRKRSMRPMVQFMDSTGMAERPALRALFAKVGLPRPLRAEDEIWTGVKVT